MQNLLVHYEGNNHTSNGLWEDLSGSGTHGTLTNFNNEDVWDHDCLILNGVNQYITTPVKWEGFVNMVSQ